MTQTVNRIRVPVTTTGSAGSATGEVTTDAPGGIRGYLENVYVDYHASAPATTDVTISEADGPARTLLTLTDTNTDADVAPRKLEQDTVGADLASSTRYSLAGQITVTVAGADALTNCVVVYLDVLQ